MNILDCLMFVGPNPSNNVIKPKNQFFTELPNQAQPRRGMWYRPEPGPPFYRIGSRTIYGALIPNHGYKAPLDWDKVTGPNSQIKALQKHL